MTTITTLDLRRKDINSLDKLVRASKTVRVTHRGKPLFTIVSDSSSIDGPIPGSAEAKKLFAHNTEQLRKSKLKSVFDPKKSIKKLYHDMLDSDKKNERR